MDHQDFYLRVAQGLSGCQLVEQQLKLYISDALQLVAKCLAGKMPFAMHGDDYANASLERLIDTFRKLTDQTQLVEEWRKCKDERNFLSHEAITYCIDPGGDFDSGAAASIEKRVAAIQPESERLCTAIHEAAKFRVHLWFDPVEPAG